MITELCETRSTSGDGIPYLRWFPWLHLFRCIRMAFSVRQIVVAIIAIYLLGAGNMVIDLLTPAKVDPSVKVFGINLPPVISIDVSLLGSPQPTLSPQVAAALIRPWDDVVRSTLNALDETAGTSSRWKSVAVGIWSVLVWSLFGVSICRLAACQFATDESGSLRRSIQFGADRCGKAIVGPLIPTSAALLLFVLALLAAIPGRIPFLGSPAVVILTPLVLLLSLVCVFLVVATLLGWPLMLAGIAYDDCDGFGSLSRSYSMWTGRIWQFFWYWFIALASGMIGLLILRLFFSSASKVAVRALQIGMGDVDTGFIGVGNFLIDSLFSAFAISFFWTSATVIYALLRRSVDRAPFTFIAPDDDKRTQRDPLPVVGIPAMEGPQGNT